MKTFFLFGLVMLLNGAQAQGFAYNIKSEDVIASAQTNFQTFNIISERFRIERKQLCSKLIGILTDSRSPNLNQCEAAYYLGELRIPEAVDALAAKIMLRLDTRHIITLHLPTISSSPVVEALIKIGIPSIPAMIRNLAESDDNQVRDLSLKVIYRIEGDKDIVQLRLQKAMAAEKDSRKQARLQAALKLIEKVAFGK